MIGGRGPATAWALALVLCAIGALGACGGSGDEAATPIDPDIVALDEQAVGRVELSFEQVGLLDADFIGILTNGGDPSSLPGWGQLAAVRDGAVIDFELADIVGINTPTPLSVPYVLDLIRPALEAVAAS